MRAGSPQKLIYDFSALKSDASLLGGKGAGLVAMLQLGLPIPPGFTLTTEACHAFYTKNKLPKSLVIELKEAIKRLERKTGRQFGGTKKPLLISIRSGAKVSMPGMMDTILNLGMTDKAAAALADETGDARFAYDTYRRYLSMYGEVVLGVHAAHFEALIETVKADKNYEHDHELSAEDWYDITQSIQKLLIQEGFELPKDPFQQLLDAVKAVFQSWMNPRAISYRKIMDIPDNGGTAVTIQQMVFGNAGDDSATGVAFTRNPSTGEKSFFGEFLMNAQGEDVVAGIRTPLPIEELQKILPAAYRALRRAEHVLERSFRDMQDIEFTIEHGKLFLLQTRSGKRTAQAAIQIAVDLVAEKKISRREAVSRISTQHIQSLLYPQIRPEDKTSIIAKGLAASPGAACGQIVFSPEEANLMLSEKRMERVILVRQETSPEDIEGMALAEGILTARGGMTSHAAVVARGMGKCCIAGCRTLEFRLGKVFLGKHELTSGSWITLDGSSGDVMLGQIPTHIPPPSAAFHTFMSWVDQIARLEVYANADTPQDVMLAKRFGAKGVGLCRTEHMFFEATKLAAMRRMILAKSGQERTQALGTLEKIQKDDFYTLFLALDGLPITIRLLDPPLHEFIPKSKAEMDTVATSLGDPDCISRMEALTEVNPMLGHRGCRLAVSFPEIYSMQVRAIRDAAHMCTKKPLVAIMIPLVSDPQELAHIRALCEKEAFGCPIGAMIEVPRAALLAGQLAKNADFFSFGTNDLTQTTFGLSRDDAAQFLSTYQEQDIFDQDPFCHLDASGVGELMEIAIDRARKQKPRLELGICGEHGGDPASIHLCHTLGLNYVSCSPYRVPGARLAAAHAAMKDNA